MGANLARTAIVTASSYVDPYTPDRAANGITGDPASRWLCSTLPCWIMLDIREVHWISKWTVKSISGSAGWPNTYRMTAFSLQGSLDGVQWTTVDSVTGNTLNTCTRSLPLPVSARYWRINIPAGGGLEANRGVSSIMDLELIEADAVPLSSLTILDTAGIEVALTPAFTPGTAGYTANVGYDITSVTVKPVAAAPSAVITVNEQPLVDGKAVVTLKAGSINTINIKVASATGSILYFVDATRASSPYLQSVVGLPSGTVFNKQVYGYSWSVSARTPTINLTSTVEDAGATLKLNGNPITSGQQQTVNLNPGSNTITIEVRSRIGNDSRTYTFHVTRG
jgi:hypothetical protein